MHWDRLISGVFMLFGGISFFRLGYLSARFSTPGAIALRLFWGFIALFGVFMGGCGALLMLGGVLPDS